MQKSFLLYLSWLAAIGGALIVMLGDLLPIPLTFVRPETLLTCFLACQVFFVTFLWPLFLPSMVREGTGVPVLLGQAGILLLFSLPMALLCANISDATATAFLAGQGLIAGLAALAAGLYSLAGSRGWRIGPWYGLGAMVLSAGLPYLGFLSHEVARDASSAGPDLSFLSAASPFWAASRAGEGPAFILAVAAAILAGVCFAATRSAAKEVDAAKPAG